MSKATQHGKKEIGRLYGVGVGPGDPELMTPKARRILSRVPIIFIPKKGKESAGYAESIIADLIGGDQEVVELVFPMVRARERLADYWRQAAESVWDHIKSGKDCALVNVGDPLLYGTFIHVLQTLRESHPEVEVEVIPGITSIQAAAATAMIPLGSDDERIAIISGNAADGVIKETLKSFDAVVFLKVKPVFSRLLAVLEEMDLVEKSVYVRRCTTQDEEIIRNLRELRGRDIDYFSLLIVRK